MARIHLERQRFDVYLPLVQQNRRRLGKRIEVIEALFPRYLFIQLDQETDNWAPIRSTVGVSALVRFGFRPAHVPDELVAFLRTREEDGLHRLPASHFAPGNTVRISEGLMQGYEGILLAKVGKDRVLILLNILGKQSKVLVDRELVEIYSG